MSELGFRNKKGRTALGTSKEEEKNDKMKIITGTLTIEPAWNKQTKTRSFINALRT